MSFTLLSKLRKALVSLRKPSYTASHVAVMTCLADRINDKTGVCFPSMQTIANESYICERHARKVISQLVDDGIVGRIKFSHRSNRYRLNLPMINDTKNNDFVAVPTEPKAGLQDAEHATENRDTVAEARLTYKLNTINEPVRDSSLNTLNGMTDTPSESFLPEAGSKPKNPVTSSSELTAPCNGVKNVHSLLMRKLRSTVPGPSTKDRKLFTAAIEKYGEPEVHQMIEWVFKQKHDFWRKHMRAAKFPCSFLCGSLPSIKRQFDDAETKVLTSANAREQERTTKGTPVSAVAPLPTPRMVTSHEYEDLDFGTEVLPDLDD